MLLVLLALQMATTNCNPNATGGVNCTTMSTPPLPQAVTRPPEPAPLPQAPPLPERGQSPAAGWQMIGLIERLNDRGLRKKIGRMIAAGDCKGAAKLAYEKGWLDVGAEIKQTCTASETAESSDWTWARAGLQRQVDEMVLRGNCKEALRLAKTGWPELRAETAAACAE